MGRSWVSSHLLTWRIALWLEIRQRANSWRAVRRNPVALAGYGIALVLLLGLAWVSIWIRTALEDPARRPPSLDEPITQLWLNTFLIVTGSVVYLLIRSAFLWHRLSAGFRTSDVEFLFPTPAFDVRLMRALMFARETLWRIGAVILSGVLIALLTHDAQTLRTIGNYYLSGGYWALSYVALRFLEYTAYRYVELWLSIGARRIPNLSWYLAVGAVVWGVAVITTLIGVAATVNLPPGPERVAAILQNPVLRVIALPSVAAADALVAPAQGLTVWIGAAGLLWLGVILLCSRQVWHNAPLLRDTIAVGVQYGVAQNRPYQEQTPYAVRLALQAREKPTTVSTPKLFQRWSPRGVRALLWKDLLIEWRTYHPLGWLFAVVFGTFLFAGLVIALPLVFRISPAVAAGIMSGVLFILFSSGGNEQRYNFNRLETQVDFLRALPFTGRDMARYFALLGVGGALWLSLSIYLPALLLAPAQWFILICAFVFTNLCLIAFTLLRAIEGMLTADFALEAQHGLTHTGVGIVAFLGALAAGGLQLLALLWGGVGGALMLLGLIGITLAMIKGLFELTVDLWGRL